MAVHQQPGYDSAKAPQSTTEYASGQAFSKRGPKEALRRGERRGGIMEPSTFSFPPPPAPPPPGIL